VCFLYPQPLILEILSQSLATRVLPVATADITQPMRNQIVTVNILIHFSSARICLLRIKWILTSRMKLGTTNVRNIGLYIDKLNLHVNQISITNLTPEALQHAVLSNRDCSIVLFLQIPVTLAKNFMMSYR